MDSKNPNRLCMGCMRERDAADRACPLCGFDEAAYQPSPHHLACRTILAGKYLTGKVLGEGGFGITYLGWDLNLDLKVAIKEYYPAGLVTRESTSSSTVMTYVGEKSDLYGRGKERFVEEARTLAKFYSLPGVVSVKDFFLENNTAYIVMEFLEGVTLKQYMAQKGGSIGAQDLIPLIRPVIESLEQIHRAGLIHRDISPDNIMFTADGRLKLVDFGAARDISSDGQKSLSVMLKPGYAPEEQYRTHGEQGPWTDVYALCATIYKCLTGVTPDEPLERMRLDSLKPPSQLGAQTTPGQDAAIMQGLEVEMARRFQSMKAFEQALYTGTPVPPPTPIPTPPPPQPAPPKPISITELSRQWIDPPKPPSWKKPVLIAVLAVLGILLFTVAVNSCSPNHRSSSRPAYSSSSSSKSSSIPSSSSSSSRSSSSSSATKDATLHYEYPSSWTSSKNANGYSRLVGIQGGVKYQFEVLDITSDTSEDIIDYTISLLPETPTPGGMGTVSTDQIGSYSGVSTGCLYGPGQSVTIYCITDGDSRVVFASWCFDFNDEQFDDSVYQEIIDSMEITYE